MRRYVAAVILILAMFTMLGATAAAVESRTDRAKPTLTFDGTTALCQVTVTEFGKEIFATLELWQGKRFIASWSDSATTRLEISKRCAVESGLLYTLTANGTIDGEPFEEASVTVRCLGGLLQ
jgi:hypothetical protein